MPRGIPNTPRKAAHNPVVMSNALESGEQPIGYTERTTNVGAGDPVLVQVADRMPDPEQAAMLAFMNEPVKVRIATSTDRNAEQVFELIVNWRSEIFRRGETKTVKRHYVDRLANCKVTTYTQQDVVNEQGVKQKLNIPHTALKYDFAIVEDSNPLGESWIKATLAMAG